MWVGIHLFVFCWQVPGPRKGGVKQFKLETITKPLKLEQLDNMTTCIFHRILNADSETHFLVIHSLAFVCHNL
jgi:hypothetical protein